MIADIDKEGSGVIDFEEFLGMMATKRAPATQCALTALTRRLPAGWASATRARRFSRPSACSTTTRRRVLMRRAGRKSGRAGRHQRQCFRTSPAASRASWRARRRLCRVCMLRPAARLLTEARRAGQD